MDSKDKKIEELGETVARLLKSCADATCAINAAKQELARMKAAYVDLLPKLQTEQEGRLGPNGIIITREMEKFAFTKMNASFVSVLNLYHNGSVEIPLVDIEENAKGPLGALPKVDEMTPHIVTMCVMNSKEAWENAQEESE